jgi:PTH1 family peptidyl-tRNA hydrolase
MPRTSRLIVGLGNPGAEYEGTRHNVGFQVVDALARRTRIDLDTHRADALVGEGRYRGDALVVALPLTYMNRSGDAVAPLMRRAGLAPSELIVVVDDLHLDVGTLRLRKGGGSGGHNGLADIERALGTSAYPRLRVGVGSDFGRGQQADYVLAPFDAEQQPVIDETLPRAVDALLCFVREGIETAMNRFNG